MKNNTKIGFAALFPRGLILTAGGLAVPSFVFAQEVVNSLQDLGVLITDFINDTLVVLIFAIAFVVFLWGLVSSFIFGGADPEKRAKGQQLMLWGLIAFFVMISVWGIVNLLVGSIDLDTTPQLPVVPIGD
ncbi:hypothetical protein [Maricaulis sp.]|uniref:hypothetical protein n=1 Tax=Maricaulis sp. TaxID=1486257 RepID=UPI002601CABD|nr:hypothetical protein [Maricaulis sp.]